MIYKAVAVVCLIVLSNFSYAEESSKESSENCTGINAFRCHKPNEAEVIKKYPLLAERNGITLMLNIQNGQSLQFEDCKETYCDVYNYILEEYFPELSYFLVRKQTIEEATYLLIHQQTGKQFEIDETPLFSPDMRRFITVSVCDAYCADRLQIWKINKSSVEPECTLMPLDYWADNQFMWRDNKSIEILKEVKVKPDDVGYTKVSLRLRLSPQGWDFSEKLFQPLAPDYCSLGKASNKR